MLFSPDFSDSLNSAAVKIQRENLKRFELENFSRYDIFQLIENRSDLYDALLKRLWCEMDLSAQSTIIFGFFNYDGNSTDAGNGRKNRPIRAIFMGLRF